jgi:hypothetical protein
MKKFFAILAVFLLGFTGIAPVHAQRYYQNDHGHHDRFQQGAYEGGRGGNYGYDTRHGYVNNNGYHPNGVGPGKGAAIGAVAGGVLGALFGGGLKGAVIGGAAGAGIGAVAGQANQNNQKRDCYEYGHC